MSSRIASCKTVFAAIAFAASLGHAGGIAKLAAADLDYDVRGSAYDDQRYSDIYRHPPPVAYPPVPYPPAPVYRDERFVPPPVHYPREARAECLPHEVISDRLQSRGWSDFHNFQVAGNVTHVRARRPSGRMFDLTVDRCSGEILERLPVEGRRAEIVPPPAAYPPPPGYQPPYQPNYQPGYRYGY